MSSRTMNDNASIYNSQNSQRILLLFKTQRVFYSKAKVALYSGLLLGVIGTVVFTCLTTQAARKMCPDISGQVTTLSSFFALLVFVVITALTTKSSEYIRTAANIQQSIDTTLFHIKKDSHALAESELNDLSAPYLMSNFSEFKNWYSDYSEMPFLKQVFCCQKENVRWDNKLRQRYASVLGISAIVVLVAIAIYSVLVNANASRFFGIFAWVFPLEKIFISQYIGLKKNIKTLSFVQDEQKNIEKHFCELSENQLACDVCNLQMRIYENRKQAVIIPDWYYSFLQKRMQIHENAIAQLTNSDGCKM